MPPVIKNRGIHQTIRGNGECVQQIARLGRVVVGKPEVILKWGLINSVPRKSGYNKGTIRSDVWYLVVSTDVRRHRLISSDYITTLPVTAEVASSSLVVPAILNKPLSNFEARPLWVQNGATLTCVRRSLGQDD